MGVRSPCLKTAWTSRSSRASWGGARATPRAAARARAGGAGGRGAGAAAAPGGGGGEGGGVGGVVVAKGPPADPHG